MEKEVGEEQYLKDIYAAMIDPAERKLLIDVFGKLPNRAEIQQAVRRCSSYRFVSLLLTGDR
jgi:hypothetical protein